MASPAIQPVQTQTKVNRNTPWIELPEFLTVEEASDFTGMGKWSVFAAVHRGDIPHRRIGRMILIPKLIFDPSLLVAKP